MISSWRKHRAARRASKNRQQYSDHNSGDLELIIPDQFLCPISHDLMKDPVTLSTGITYDRHSIETWMDAGHATCPITNQLLQNPEHLPNHAIRKMIQSWCVDNKSLGVERIPTPRIPMTSHDASGLLSDLKTAVQMNNDDNCDKFVRKIKDSAKESDRNRRCFVANGAAEVLSQAFDSYARRGVVDKLLEEILSALIIMIIPRHDEETNRSLSTTASLQMFVSIMRFGSLSARRNAVVAVKSVLSFDQNKANDLLKIEGSLDALVQLIKEPICPATTKSSLLALYHILTPSEPQPLEKAIATSLAETGLIPLLLETLVDAERSICEKALAVLDGLCSYEDGRLKAYENALTVPVLVKKLLRVSDLATELSISVLLKLSKHDENGDAGVIMEALQVGAFQKMLLVLQIGTSDATKEKVTELLKLLNSQRSNVECTDSMDFKNLKRPF